MLWPDFFYVSNRQHSAASAEIVPIHLHPGCFGNALYKCLNHEGIAPSNGANVFAFFKNLFVTLSCICHLNLHV